MWRSDRTSSTLAAAGHDYEAALVHFERALEIWKQVYPEPNDAHAIANLNLGTTLHASGVARKR